MSRSFRRSAASVVAALALWLVTLVAALADEDAEIAARLDALADATMLTDQVPGAIAAVVTGETVIQRGYGLADIGVSTPADPDDARFDIGSITKLFTWIAVMMLDARGARMAFLRDETGQIVRPADGTGAQTHERLRGMADAVWLWLTLGLPGFSR